MGPRMKRGEAAKMLATEIRRHAVDNQIGNITMTHVITRMAEMAKSPQGSAPWQAIQTGVQPRAVLAEVTRQGHAGGLF